MWTRRSTRHSMQLLSFLSSRKFERKKCLHANETQIKLFSHSRAKLISFCWECHDGLLFCFFFCSCIITFTLRIWVCGEKKALYLKESNSSSKKALLSIKHIVYYHSSIGKRHGSRIRNYHWNLNTTWGVRDDDFHLCSGINGRVNRGCSWEWRDWQGNSQQHCNLLENHQVGQITS